MRQGHCSRCGRFAWINAATSGGALMGEYCAKCFDEVDHDEPRSNASQTDSGPNQNDASFDNVIRALEEDR